MPNWCHTTYAVTGDSKELSKLRSLIKDLLKRKTSILPNGFGSTWLGNLVHLLGGDPTQIRCRGRINDLWKDEGALWFTTTTAWDRLPEFIDFMRQNFPHLQFYYSSEEPLMELYCTNDSDGRFFPYRYRIEGHRPNEVDLIYEEFSTLAEVHAFAENLIGQSIPIDPKDINNALGDWADANDTDCQFMAFHLRED